MLVKCELFQKPFPVNAVKGAIFLLIAYSEFIEFVAEIATENS